MNNIKEYNFSDLYEMGSGISSKPEQAGHGAPFVSFSTVFNNYFLPEKVKDLMDTSEDEQEVYSVKGGDILLTRTSETIDELGMSCVALEDYPRATFSGFVKRLRPTQSDITYPKFMGFYLRSKFFRKTMTNNAVLTLRASLNEDIFSYLKLYLPDYDTQKKIGDFLYSLNAKIELNNRINAELEAMAKTIYGYWFVQFDFPDKKGKPYKASGGKMVWSDELKREMPEGWSVVKMSEWINIDKSGDWGKEEPEGNFTKKVTCIRGADINGLNGLDELKPPVRFILEKNSFKVLKSHDIVIEISGGSPTQSTGRLAFITEATINRFDNPLICSNFCKPISLKNEKLLYNFVYYWNSLYDNGIFFGYEGKTSGIKNLLLDSFVNSFYTVVPEENIVNKFYGMMENIQKKKQTALAENQKLTELRDWLLPMLMNGQVKIRDAAKPKVSNNYNLDSNLKPTNQYFYQTQVVAAIINASKKNKISHGEMTLAKYSYLVDKIYQVPTYFKYDRWHLGPYPKEMKKIVNNKKFFKIQNNELNVVQQQKEYAFKFEQQVESAVKELASLFNKYNGKERSRQTELLATVCKVVEDIQSTNLTAVRESMKNWPINLVGKKYKNKAEKFSEEETKSLLMIIKSKGWNQILISSDAMATAAEPEVNSRKSSKLR